MLQALVSLALLTYVHYALTCHPVNCLSTKNLVMTGSREHDIVRDIIRDGIIRVEVIRGAAAGSNYSLLDSYRKEFSAELLYEDHEAVPTPGSKGDTRSSKSSDDLVVVSDSADQSSDDNAAIGVERSADNNYQQSDNSSTAGMDIIHFWLRTSSNSSKRVKRAIPHKGHRWSAHLDFCGC